MQNENWIVNGHTDKLGKAAGDIGKKGKEFAIKEAKWLSFYVDLPGL